MNKYMLHETEFRFPKVLNEYFTTKARQPFSVPNSPNKPPAPAGDRGISGWGNLHTQTRLILRV